MKRIFVQTKIFSLELDNLIDKRKILQEDYEAFELRLLKNPEEGDIIQGCGGIRKTRLKSISKGKSGGFRVCYLDIPKKEKLFLIFIYGKNVQEDLTPEERSLLRDMALRLKGDE